MDQYTKIELKSKDAKLFLNALSTINILQMEIDLLEYTGEFHSSNHETCEHIINSLRNILMKKLYETE